MAGYSPDEIRAIVKRFPERPDPIAAAEEYALSALGFGEEIRRVEEEIGSLSHYVLEPLGEREQLEEQRRRLVVAALELDWTALPPESQKPHASKQGQWEGKAFSTAEVDKAAKIHMGNHDLTSWEVWVRYQRVRDLDDDGRLGRRKVDDLIEWLDEDESRWDATHEHVEGLVRSSREPGRVLIPRRQTAS
jgi:hypothetical protein